EEISMFTTGDDVPLTDVLKKLYEIEKGKPSLDPKEDADKLFKKLGEALPEHDRERIYDSDVRKLFAWYDQLLKSGDLEKKEEKKKEPEDKEKGEEKGTKAKKSTAKDDGTKKPKAKTAAKKAAPKSGGA